MDVNQQAVIETLGQYGANILIHGHTHRPAIHSLTVDNALTKRFVLGDWGENYWWIEVIGKDIQLCNAALDCHFTPKYLSD